MAAHSTQLHDRPACMHTATGRGGRWGGLLRKPSATNQVGAEQQRGVTGCEMLEVWSLRGSSIQKVSVWFLYEFGVSIWARKTSQSLIRTDFKQQEQLWVATCVPALVPTCMIIFRNTHMKLIMLPESGSDIHRGAKLGDIKSLTSQSRLKGPESQYLTLFCIVPDVSATQSSEQVSVIISLSTCRWGHTLPGAHLLGVFRDHPTLLQK